MFKLYLMTSITVGIIGGLLNWRSDTAVLITACFYILYNLEEIYDFMKGNKK